MYVTLYTAVPTVSLLPNIKYVCYAIYRSTKCQLLTQYAVCMLRYIPQYQLSASYPISSVYVTLYTQYQLSASYPIGSMYVTPYTAVPTVSLLPNIQYVCYAIYPSNKCQPLTHCTVCMLRYIPEKKMSAS